MAKGFEGRIKRLEALQRGDVDPIDELFRIVNQAQERDADDERRLYHPMRGDRPTSFQR